MRESVGDRPPVAVGVAISPVPVIAVILMLLPLRAGAAVLTALLVVIGVTILGKGVAGI